MRFLYSIPNLRTTEYLYSQTFIWFLRFSTLQRCLQSGYRHSTSAETTKAPVKSWWHIGQFWSFKMHGRHEKWPSLHIRNGATATFLQIGHFKLRWSIASDCKISEVEETLWHKRFLILIDLFSHYSQLIQIHPKP